MCDLVRAVRAPVRARCTSASRLWVRVSAFVRAVRALASRVRACAALGGRGGHSSLYARSARTARTTTQTPSPCASDVFTVPAQVDAQHAQAQARSASTLARACPIFISLFFERRGEKL